MDKDIQQTIVSRVYELDDEILTLISTGTGVYHSEKEEEIIKFSKGTIAKLNDLISRRNELLGLLKVETENNGRSNS